MDVLFVFEGKGIKNLAGGLVQGLLISYDDVDVNISFFNESIPFNLSESSTCGSARDLPSGQNWAQQGGGRFLCRNSLH